MKIKGHRISLVIGVLALFSLFAPEAFSARVQEGAAAFLGAFGGWTLFVATSCLLFCLGVLVLPHGRRVIGGPDAKPEFRAVTWTAMMFAAGMGAGLVFWGAAEPLIHAAAPPPGQGLEPGSVAARTRSLAITQFHWALHAWAIYGAAAIAIGLVATASGSLLPSSPFTWLPPRFKRVIDLTALVAVLFGIVASLGQGILQVGAGLETISGGRLPDSAGFQLLSLSLVAAAYLGSAALGLRKGIAVLSNINVGIGLVLAGWIFVAGPSAGILATIVKTASAYAAELPRLSVTLRDPGAARSWTEDWSLTYFLWWMAWTPFVGVFLARISRGRSLRSFVLAAVVVPSLVTLVWFSVLGGAALGAEAQGAEFGIASFDTASLATYRLLETLPLTALFQTVTMLLVVIFLVTSADSGAFVLSMLSQETSEPGVAPRLYWGAILAVLTGGALLSGEGQDATRALAVAGAVPLTFLLAAQTVTAAARLFGLRPTGQAPKASSAELPTSSR